MKTKQFPTKSGEVLKLVAVSQTELAPLVQKLGPTIPQPPVEVVTTSSGTKEFANENDKNYLEAKKAFELENGLFMAAVLIELGVSVKFTEEEKEEVAERQAKLEDIFPGRPENKLKTYVYVKMCCDDDEIQQLMESISSINNPSPQKVQAHLDAFRDGVQGSSVNTDTSAPKWNGFKEPELELATVPSSEVLGDRPNSFLRTVGPRVAG